ncbi:MAG: transposase [Romboutsia sp.]|nr:transposase [Romboutsia sp.]
MLHTFGDDLKFNPHIHSIVTQGGIDKNNKWFNNLEHIPYSYLRKSWQKFILDLIEKSRFNAKYLINKMYSTYTKGFYVNVEKSIKDIKHTIKYLGRYLSRVPISNSRIIKYDGKNVTYTYKEKTTRKRFFNTINVLDFIGKLVQHINKKHFKSIRRYGLYSRRLNKLSIKIINLFNFVKQRNIKDLLSQSKAKKY